VTHHNSVGQAQSDSWPREAWSLAIAWSRRFRHARTSDHRIRLDLWPSEARRIIALALLFHFTGCSDAGPALPSPIAFEVQTDGGCPLMVSVYSYAMHQSDTRLAHLVKAAMEVQLRHEPVGGSVHSCPHQPRVAWQVSGRSGRPPRTFVGVELLKGPGETRSAFSLVAGPDEPMIDFYLSEAIKILTSRILI
jgi:hypothetical protein